MNIRKKIMLSFSILIFFIFGISLFGYLEISKINDKYGDMISLDLEGFYMTSEFQYNVAMQGIQLRQYVLEKDAETLRTLEENQNLVDKGVVELFGIAKSDEIKQRISVIEQHNVAFNEAAEEVKAAIANNDEARAITLITQDAKRANTEMLAEAQSILDVVKKRFTLTATETDTWVQSILVLLIVISLISLAAALFISRSLNRTISKPLHKLAAAASEISIGNLTVANIETKSNDEVGQLSNAFNKMKASLQDIIVICKDNAIDLSSMSEELTASTTHVATTSSNVATNIEAMSSSITSVASVSQQTSASIEQTAHDIDAIANTTQSLKDRSQKASSLATSGNEHLTEAKAQMNTIYHATQSTADVVQNLSEQSQQIQQMTSMITQIADQTNLLALNAAIEAARAGDAGKGFAVVADEVRKLAEQSQHSAGMIIELTSNILHKTKNAEQSMRVSLDKVEQGVTIIDKSDRMFKNIVDEFDKITSDIEKITHMTEQISAATQQVTSSSHVLATNMQHVAHNVEDVSQQTEEQVAIIEEINAISETLTTRACQLTRSIAHFQLAK